MIASVGEIATAAVQEQYAAVMPVWPLTGRVEELGAVLTHARGRGVVLAGAPGVGKTRLAREALVRARRNGREWRYVAATTSARSVPLGAFADYATRLGEEEQGAGERGHGVAFA